MVSIIYDFFRQFVISDSTKSRWRKLDLLFLAKNAGGVVINGNMYPFFIILNTNDGAMRVLSQKS